MARPANARRRTPARVGLAAGLMALGLGAVGTTSALAADQSVGTNGNNFTPDDVMLSVGEKVTIANTNGGPGAHDVVWEGPGAPAPFPSAPSTAKWSTSRTFTMTGNFRYYCSLHGGTGGGGMSGIVRVSAPPVTPPTDPPPTEPPPPVPVPPGGTPPPPPAPPADPGAPVAPVGGVVDTVAPRLGTKVAATRRKVTLKVTLGEQARVLVIVQRRGRTIARRTFRDRPQGVSTLQVPVRVRPGRLTVWLTVVDDAGNATRRTLHLRVD